MFPVFQPIIKTTQIIIRATRDAIIPFTEQPPGEISIDGIKSKKENDSNACDLFSCFTADIIREEVVFTR